MSPSSGIKGVIVIQDGEKSREAPLHFSKSGPSN